MFGAVATLEFTSLQGAPVTVDNWEDMEREVEEKWPSVSKEIRAIVPKKGTVLNS